MTIAVTYWVVADLEASEEGAGYTARLYPYLYDGTPRKLKRMACSDQDPYRALGLALKDFIWSTKRLPRAYSNLDYNVPRDEEHNQFHIRHRSSGTSIKLELIPDGRFVAAISDNSFSEANIIFFADLDPARALGSALDTYIAFSTGQAFIPRITGMIEDRPVRCPRCKNAISAYFMLPSKNEFLCQDCWARANDCCAGKTLSSPADRGMLERLLLQREHLKSELAHMRAPHKNCDCNALYLCPHHNWLATLLFSAYKTIEEAIQHLCITDELDQLKSGLP